MKLNQNSAALQLELDHCQQLRLTPLGTLLHMDSKPEWKILASRKKQALHDAIPREWLISHLPISEHPNVIDVPRKCGLLTARELEITETADVEVILRNLCTSVWTAVETTRAFSKRAVIAHQLVRRVLALGDLAE